MIAFHPGCVLCEELVPMLGMETGAFSNTSSELLDYVTKAILVDVESVPKQLITREGMILMEGSSLALHILMNQDKIRTPDNPELVDYLNNIGPAETIKLPYVVEGSARMSNESNVWGEYSMPHFGDMIIGFEWRGDEPLTFRYLTYSILQQHWFVHVEKTLQPGERFILPKNKWSAIPVYWPPRVHFATADQTTAKKDFHTLYLFLPHEQHDATITHFTSLMEQAGIQFEEPTLEDIIQSITD